MSKFQNRETYEAWKNGQETDGDRGPPPSTSAGSARSRGSLAVRNETSEKDTRSAALQKRRFDEARTEGRAGLKISLPIVVAFGVPTVLLWGSSFFAYITAAAMGWGVWLTVGNVATLLTGKRPGEH